MLSVEGLEGVIVLEARVAEWWGIPVRAAELLVQWRRGAGGTEGGGFGLSAL